MEYLRPLWTCFSRFCSCLHCTEELESPGYEPTERTHLLTDPITHSPAFRRSNSDNFSNEYSQSLPKKEDQNALCRLVQSTANNMIDVGAMDAHNLEHQEYNDRIKLYSQRLQQQWSNIQHPGKSPTGLLLDVSNPMLYLPKPAFPEDMVQMKNAIGKIRAALMDVRIDHKEAIVVPFRIP